MIVTNTIRTIALASILAAGSLALFAQTAGARAASAPSVSEVVVTKATDAAAGDTLIERWQANGIAKGEVDGRDFLIWQRHTSAAEAGSINQLTPAPIFPSTDTLQHEVSHALGLGTTR